MNILRTASLGTNFTDFYKKGCLAIEISKLHAFIYLRTFV